MSHARQLGGVLESHEERCMTSFLYGAPAFASQTDDTYLGTMTPKIVWSYSSGVYSTVCRIN